jgi:hypothetical protein
MWATDYPHSDGFFPGAPQMSGATAGVRAGRVRAGPVINVMAQLGTARSDMPYLM